MKIIKNKFFICILLLLSGVANYGQTTCTDDCGNLIDCVTRDYIGLPPPAPCEPYVLPINENIFILLFIALLFGIYVIYKYQQNKKTAA